MPKSASLSDSDSDESSSKSVESKSSHDSDSEDQGSQSSEEEDKSNPRSDEEIGEKTSIQGTLTAEMLDLGKKQKQRSKNNQDATGGKEPGSDV